MATFGTLIQNLWDVGFNLFLAFLFVLAVVYGVLRRIELFDDNTVDATIATVTAFFTVAGVYTWFGTQFFSQFFGLVGIITLVILGLVVMMGMMGADITEYMEGDDARGFYIALTILGFLLAGMITYFDYGFLSDFLNSETLVTVIMLIVLGIVINSVTSD